MFQFNNTLMLFVKKDLEHGLIPMLLGEPGIGKSSWLMALADNLHTRCFVLPCNQLADKADLTGARLVPTEVDVKVPDGKGGHTIQKTATYKQVFYPHAVIHDAIAYAQNNPRETPILFMDELNRTTPDVTSEALSIPTLRAIGSVSLPPNLRVVIAGNDKGNVTSLDEASVSRFVLYHVGPDINTFLNLDPSLNPFIKKVLQAHPEFLFCKTAAPVVVAGQNQGQDDDEPADIEAILGENEDMAQITTPRTISGLSRWLNSFSQQEMQQALSMTQLDETGQAVSVLQEGIVGHVGDTPFARALLGEIASGVLTINTAAPTANVAKPSCYDQMKAQADVTSLDQFISGMTDNERSGCLAYALFEHADNRTYIQSLANLVTRMLPADVTAVMNAGQANLLDGENVSALLASNTPLATSLSVILETYAG